MSTGPNVAAKGSDLVAGGTFSGASGEGDGGRLWRRMVAVAALSLLFIYFYSGYWHWTAEESRLLIRALDRKLSITFGWPLSGTPDLTRIGQRLQEKGVALGAPVFLRIFKQDYELELWMQKGGKYVHFATYPVCRRSGDLGPKLRQGDRQAPEGFYTVARSQLNPRSRWHRSFNLGYPNLFDRAYSRTGSALMVHGGCSSSGCYAMTNAVMDEIWKLISAAFDSGQRRFQVHVFPFRMTERRMALHKSSPWRFFWEDLQKAYDFFEHSQVPPRISLCGKRYVAEPGEAGSQGGGELRLRCFGPVAPVPDPGRV